MLYWGNWDRARERKTRKTQRECLCVCVLQCWSVSYVLYSVAVNFGVNLFFLSFPLFFCSFFSFILCYILSFCLFYSFLICFSHMTVTTHHRSVAVGTKLEYDVNGHIVSKTPTPRQVCGWNFFLFFFWTFFNASLLQTYIHGALEDMWHWYSQHFISRKHWMNIHEKEVD